PDYGDAAALLEALEQRRSSLQQTREFFQLYGGAVVCFMNGDLGAALRSAQALYKQGFEESTLLRLLAVDCTQRGEYRKAEAMLLRAIELNPYDYDLHFRLGGLYYSILGDRGRALEHLRRSLSLDPLQENSRLIQGIIDKLG
ncbi:bacterial transcriptional activator domain-containing protein, partial [bacterium]|nr:bacterial transcriptional activator domain-containing protein [bacterium]